MIDRLIKYFPRSLSHPQLAYFVGIIILSFIVSLLYHPKSQPIVGDRAYLLYMAQAMQRGEPIYQTTTFGYTPFSIQLSAGMMHVGDWLGLPSYLAPRYLSLLITTLSCGLLYVITAHASLNHWVGMVASFTMLNFDFLMVLTASNLEPKILVQFLTLLTIASVQRRWWWPAGIAVGLAAASWQPALMIGGMVFLLTIYDLRKGSPSALISYLSGFLLGLLPFVSYLALTGQWADFIQQGILFKLTPRPQITKSLGIIQPIAPITSILRALRLQNILFFAAALAGFFKLLAQLYRGGWRSISLFFFHPRFGGLFILTSIWLAYMITASLSGVEFHGAVDILPFFYLIAFWTAWGCFYLFVAWQVRQSARPEETAPSSSTKKPRWFAALALVILTLAVVRASRYEVQFDLDEEIALLQTVLPAHHSTTFLTINASEFYVLKEQPTPWRYLFMTPYFVEFVNWKEAEGCTTLLNDLDQSQYQRVVINLQPHWDNSCLQQIIDHLNDSYHNASLDINLGPEGCGTTDLLKRLERKWSETIHNWDFREWGLCFASKWASAYQQTESGEYLVWEK